MLSDTTQSCVPKKWKPNHVLMRVAVSQAVQSQEAIRFSLIPKALRQAPARYAQQLIGNTKTFPLKVPAARYSMISVSLRVVYRKQLFDNMSGSNRVHRSTARTRLCLVRSP